MPDQRPSMTDPYRTLGLPPGAPMAEVKRAYRRLAKAYHPDSAGESALPRFLAIHEAYEAIRTGRPMAPGRAPAASPAPAGGAAPWRADPDRARTAREQARRRAGPQPAGSTSGAGAASGPRAGNRSSGTSGAGPRAETGARAETGGRTGTSGGGSSKRRRHVRKATMGSTSYDEARDPADPNDPSWSGASWYGPSTGEYWIINPREYADPRKHGPEYQSRARRMAAEAAALGEADASSDAEPELEDARSDDDDVRAQAGSTRTARTRTARTRTAHARPAPRAESPTTGGEATWTFGTAAPAARPRPARPTGSPATAAPAPRDAWGAAWPDDARTIREGLSRRNGGPGISPRDLIGTTSDDPIRRLGIALVAWPPIGLAAAALIGDVTGCASFSADCGGTEPLLPWLAQAAILGLLLLLPPIARLLAGGAIGVLVALVPLTAFLVAVGGSGAPQAGFALSFLLGIAWIAGVAWALAQSRRRALPGATT